MKSEHRHELKTNELERLVSHVTPFLEKYSNYILIGLGVLVVVGGAAIFISGSSSGAAAGWKSMFTAGSVEDYASIADKYPGKPVGAWARLNEAQEYYLNGIQESFTDRESANSDLKKAAELFQVLVNDSGVSLEIRQRALFGLARTTEVTSGGDTEPAIQYYEQLVQLSQDPQGGGPKSIFQQLAEARMGVLRSEQAKDFYAWFQKQNPQPADRTQPNDALGLPPGHPPIGEVTLPPIPKELRLPESKSNSASPSGDAGATSTPAENPSEAAPPDNANEDAGDRQPAAEAETPPESGSSEKPPQTSE